MNEKHNNPEPEIVQEFRAQGQQGYWLSTTRRKEKHYAIDDKRAGKAARQKRPTT